MLAAQQDFSLDHFFLFLVPPEEGKLRLKMPPQPQARTPLSNTHVQIYTDPGLVFTFDTSALNGYPRTLIRIMTL